MKQNNKKDKTGAVHKTATIIGAILCVILLPILIINITLIVRSYVNQDDGSERRRIFSDDCAYRFYVPRY